MTIAVGMICSDGMLLATDRQLMQPAAREWELDDFEGISKITDLSDHKVAYARIGDSFTKDAGAMLADSLTSGNFDMRNKELSLKNIAKQAFAPIPRNDNSVLNEERSLLVAFYDSPVGEMWRVRLTPIPIEPERITTISIKGATGNAARYFQCYFRPNKLLDRSLFLAANIVLTAGRLDPVMVNGLDLAIFRNSACRFLTATEMQVLATDSQRLHDLIGERFSQPSGLNVF